MYIKKKAVFKFRLEFSSWAIFIQNLANDSLFLEKFNYKNILTIWS